MTGTPGGSLLGRLLAPPVEPIESFSDQPDEPVFPGEEDLIAAAVPGRRREFVTARRCAREALARLGCPPVVIRPGTRREPQWPPGTAGSITHCTGYRAAAVVRTGGGIASLGIDAEPHGPVPRGVLPRLLAGDEARMLSRLRDAEPGIHWGLVLFSAKESIYKAWYPLTQRRLGFRDAELAIDAAAGTFTARLSVPGHRIGGGPPLTVMRGRFLIDRGLVLTTVVV